MLNAQIMRGEPKKEGLTQELQWLFYFDLEKDCANFDLCVPHHLLDYQVRLKSPHCHLIKDTSVVIGICLVDVKRLQSFK